MKAPLIIKSIAYNVGVWLFPGKSGKLASAYAGLVWYTEKMLYSALLLRVDRLLEAARYREFIRGRPPRIEKNKCH
jgi:hypothetical protein